MEAIRIVEYDERWPVEFAELGSRLRSALGSVALRIDHIGSTSIPRLAAKPILDIQIAVASFEPLDAFKVPLECAGFVHRADNPELTKRYFRERPGERRTHIHVRRLGTFSEQWPLLFRDYLRSHPQRATAYADLKRTLAARYTKPAERHTYQDAKMPFLWETIRLADEWAQSVGWMIGATDA